MRRTIKVVLMVTVAIAVGLGIVYAAETWITADNIRIESTGGWVKLFAKEGNSARIDDNGNVVLESDVGATVFADTYGAARLRSKDVGGGKYARVRASQNGEARLESSAGSWVKADADGDAYLQSNAASWVIADSDGNAYMQSDTAAEVLACTDGDVVITLGD